MPAGHPGVERLRQYFERIKKRPVQKQLFTKLDFDTWTELETIALHLRTNKAEAVRTLIAWGIDEIEKGGR